MITDSALNLCDNIQAPDASRLRYFNTFERVLNTTACHLNDNVLIAGRSSLADAVSRAKLFPPVEFVSLMSTPMMRSAPAMRAPMIAERPIPPRPNTATLSPFSVFSCV